MIEFHALSDPPEPRLQGIDIEATATFTDLARVLRRNRASFSQARPFLKAAAARNIEHGRQPMVGLSWGSVNPITGAGRSLSLSAMTRAFAQADVRFVTLQYGDVSADLARAKAETGIEVAVPKADFIKDLRGFTDAIAEVDLVISIQNTTVHFAGALGKPCWVLLPEVGLWIWGNHRKAGLWYESVRLFRSRSDGWPPLLQDIGARLRGWAQEFDRAPGAATSRTICPAGP